MLIVFLIKDYLIEVLWRLYRIIFVECLVYCLVNRKFYKMYIVIIDVILFINIYYYVGLVFFIVFFIVFGNDKLLSLLNKDYYLML